MKTFLFAKYQGGMIGALAPSLGITEISLRTCTAGHTPEARFKLSLATAPGPDGPETAALWAWRF